MSHTEHMVFALKAIDSKESSQLKTLEYNSQLYEIFSKSTDTIGLYTNLKDKENTTDLVFAKGHVYAGTKKNVEEDLAGELASSLTPFRNLTEMNLRNALAEARKNIKTLVS